jgi:hypothetical protein
MARRILCFNEVAFNEVASIFSADLTTVPQGALRQARILNLSCTKTSAFF